MNENDSSSSSVSNPAGPTFDQDSELSGALPPSKTPMFQAMHAARYQRQELIKQIQDKWGRRLICYVSGRAVGIDRDDTVGFADLLYNVRPDRDLDFLLHTSGGDIDAAEKLVSMVRATIGEKKLRVLVPDFAKSAGTLMALAADQIVMGNTSELGPIDPQVTRNDGQGNRVTQSIQSYLDAYKDHSEALQKNPNDIAAQMMLGKLDPSRLKSFEALKNRARILAEEHLRRWMFGNQQATINITEIVNALMDTNRWLSHGQMIGWQDAMQIGLAIAHLDSATDEEWRACWRLYCLQRLAIEDRQKLYESDHVSLVF